MVVMVAVIEVVWKCCPSPAERWRYLLLLVLTLAAMAMNMVAGCRLRARGPQTEERLRVFEEANSIQSNHGTNWQGQ